MRIGFLPGLDPSWGGVYQYSLTMLSALNDQSGRGCEDEFIVLTKKKDHPALAGLNGRNWTINPLQPVLLPTIQQQAVDLLRKVVGEGPHREAWRWVRRRWQRPSRQETPALPNLDKVQFRPEMNRWFRHCGAELILYPVPERLSFEAGVPYIMAIHDLQHRLQPEFPDFSANGEWERLEYLFRNGSRYATLLLADSEVGKEDILNFYGCYGVTPDRVKVLPFLPASYLGVDVPESEQQRIRAGYDLPERYLFYPAQFWPHKNHGGIVQALALLKQEHSIKIPVVFCGSHAPEEIRVRTFHEVMSLASQLGVIEDIHYLGYAPAEDMSGLYAGSVALVMPTFFGPTNIPVLEAWAFGCPVLTSDIRGVREQVGDASVLVDPGSVEAIADGIYRLWTDQNLRCALADRGRRRLASYTPDDYRQRLVEILKEAKARVRSENPRRPKKLSLTKGKAS